MKFLELRLSANSLVQQISFYRETLGLELLAETPEHFTVQVGSSLLHFDISEGEGGAYHFAFNIPENKLSEAKAWLLERVELLKENGQNQFSSESWNAEQVYFLDADGNILEFIARHELPNASTAPFSSQYTLNVSEIGYVVPDVARTLAALDRLGLAPYREVGEKFAAVGDAHGLLILAETNRPWFPTAGLPTAGLPTEMRAEVAPLELTLSSASPFDYTEPGLPYRLRGVLEPY